MCVGPSVIDVTTAESTHRTLLHELGRDALAPHAAIPKAAEDADFKNVE